VCALRGFLPGRVFPDRTTRRHGLARPPPNWVGWAERVVTKQVHDLASEEPAAASRNGAAVQKLNLAKRTEISNVVTNKADVYMRQLSWLFDVAPRIMETPAAEATAEKMSTIKFTDDERKAIDEAVTAAAILAKVDI